jgi:mechanosensitive ion channel-like protein
MDHYVSGQSGAIDWSNLVGRPLKDMLVELVKYIPDLLAGLLILLAGWLIAHVCRVVVSKFLKSVGFNNVAEKIGISEVDGKNDKKIAPNQLAGLLAFWGVMLTSIIMMLARLGLRDLSFHIDKLFSYVITILIIAIIAVVGIALSLVVYKIIHSTAKNSGIAKPTLPANIAKWVILVFTVIVCLSQIGIDIEIFLIPLGVVLITLCITFILAFGFGGRHWAAKVLDKIGKK